MEKTLGNIPRLNQSVEIQFNQGADTSSTNTPTNYIGSRSESDSPKKLTDFKIETDQNGTDNDLPWILPLEMNLKIFAELDIKSILNLIEAYPGLKDVFEAKFSIDLTYIETLMSKRWHSMVRGIIRNNIFRRHPLAKISADNLIIDCSCRPMGYKSTTEDPFSEDFKGKVGVHITHDNSLIIDKVIDGDITSFKDTMKHIPFKYTIMNNGNAIIFEYKDRHSPMNFYCIYYIKDSRLEKLFIDYPNKDKFEFHIINNTYPYESSNKGLIVLTNNYRLVIQGIVFENDTPKTVTLLDIGNISNIFSRLENVNFGVLAPLASNDGKVLIQQFLSSSSNYLDRRHALILKLAGDVYQPSKEIMYDIVYCDVSCSGVYITTLYKENRELWIYDLQNDNKQLLSKNIKTYVMNHAENMIVFITKEEETETVHLYNYNEELKLWKKDNNISKQLDDPVKDINNKFICITSGDDTLIIEGIIKEEDVEKEAVQVLSLNNIETEARNIVLLYEECSEKSYYPHIEITLNGLMFVTNYSPREIKIYTYNKHRTKLNIRATISLDTARSEKLNYLDPYGRFIQLSSKRIIKLDKLGTREV